MHSSSATLGLSSVVPSKTSLCPWDVRGALVRVGGSAYCVRSGPMASAATHVQNIKAISAKHNNILFIVLIQRRWRTRLCKGMCARPRGRTARQAKLRFRLKYKKKMKLYPESKNGQVTFYFLQTTLVTGTASTRYQLKEICLINRIKMMDNR